MLVPLPRHGAAQETAPLESAMGRDGADALEGSFSPYKIRDHRCYLEEQGLTDTTPPSPEEHLSCRMRRMYIWSDQ